MTALGEMRRRPDRVTLARYAAATGDFNPLHLDDEHARGAGFDRVIAHGLLLYGYAASYLTEAFGGDPTYVRRLQLRFVKPVLVNDEVTVKGFVVAERDDETDVEVEVRGNEEIVATGNATVEHRSALPIVGQAAKT